VLGHHIWEMVPVELSDDERAEALKELEEKGRFRAEAITYRKNGTPVYVEGITIALRGDQQGQITGYVNIRRDITERKRAEEELRRSEAYLAEGQKLSHTGSWAWNASSDEMFCSDELLRIFGQEAAVTKPCHEDLLQMIHPEDQSRVRQTFEDAVRSGTNYEAEYRIVLSDGSIRHIHNLAHQIFDDSGTLREYVGTAMDVTQRKEAEASIQEAREHVDMILASISDQFFGLDKDWRFTYLNQHAARQMQQLGKDPEWLIGKVLWDEFPDVPNEAAVRRVMSERVPITDELYYPPLGEWVENHMYPSQDGGLVTFQRYITDRKQTEEALRRSEAFLAEGQKISHTGSWAVRFPSWDVFWSQEMFSIYGVDPANTKISQEIAFLLIHPEDRQFVKEKFERAVRDKSDFAVEHRAMLPDGTLKHLSALGHPIINESGGLVEYVGTVVDISDRKRAEESLRTAYAELANATRVTMMGELAASIAHEINQPLGAITNNGNAGLHLIAAIPDNTHDLREVLTEIVNDAERASAIIRRIRALVQRSPTEKNSLQVNDVMAEALALAHRELMDHRITVRTEFSDDLPRVRGDRIQLQQVFLNVILNAVDAMSAVEDNRRVLNIRAQRDSLENKPAVLLSLEDQGDGFSLEDGERLFDAFFTTKQHGMGMGLRISRSIVETHGGRLWATPNAGPGATLHCALPVEESVE
jgi:PAS domain S-box-containing protein